MPSTELCFLPRSMKMFNNIVMGLALWRLGTLFGLLVSHVNDCRGTLRYYAIVQGARRVKGH